MIDIYKVKKTVNKYILRKNLDQDELTGEFHQMFKEEIVTVIHKLFQTTEVETYAKTF